MNKGQQRWQQVITYPTKFTPFLRVMNAVVSILIIALIGSWLLHWTTIHAVLDILFTIGAFVYLAAFLLDYFARHKR